MEAGYSYCDNHSDRDSDKLGNGIVYAMKTKKGESGWVRSSSCLSTSFTLGSASELTLLSLNHNLAALDDVNLLALAVAINLIDATTLQVEVWRVRIVEVA